MDWSYELELSLWKKMRSIYPMPEKGKGYCIEVFKDGSGYQQIDFTDLEHKGKVVRRMAVEKRPCAIFCNLENNDLCGFSGVFLVIDERHSTGEVLCHTQEDDIPFNPELLRQEYLRLVHSLMRQKAPQGNA